MSHVSMYTKERTTVTSFSHDCQISMKNRQTVI